SDHGVISRLDDIVQGQPRYIARGDWLTDRCVYLPDTRHQRAELGVPTTALTDLNQALSRFDLEPIFATRAQQHGLRGGSFDAAQAKATQQASRPLALPGR